MWLNLLTHLVLLRAYYDVIRFSLYHMTRHNQLEVSNYLRKMYTCMYVCIVHFDILEYPTPQEWGTTKLGHTQSVSQSVSISIHRGKVCIDTIKMLIQIHHGWAWAIVLIHKSLVTNGVGKIICSLVNKSLSIFSLLCLIKSFVSQSVW